VPSSIDGPRVHESHAPIQANEDLKAAKWSRIALISFLLIGFALRIGFATYIPSVVHPDEIYQTQEPAHRLAFGYGIVSWEWRDGVRSWVLPAVLAVVMRATAWMGAGSSGYLFGIKTVLSLLSLTPILFGYMWARRVSGAAAATVAGGACALWCDLVYFGPRALSEVVASNLLLAALYMGCYAERGSDRARLVCAGLLLGLTVALRIQLAPAALVTGFFIWRFHIKSGLHWLIAAFTAPILAFGIVDAFTLSYPFQSFVRYFWVNVIAGVSKKYGVEPWYFFLVMLFAHFGPLLLLAIVGVRKSAALAGTAGVIILSHSMLAHKEWRFIYPALPMIVVLAAIGLTEIVSRLRYFKSVRSYSVALVCLTILGTTSVIYALKMGWQWRKDAGGAALMDRLSRDASVCGIGIYEVEGGMQWYKAGGYTHLHRNVPMYVVRDQREFELEVPAMNVVLANNLTLANGFKLQSCRYGVCVYRREGSCSGPNSFEVNAVLRSRGQ
jgi:phosphatidylinositol glycan class B